MPKLTVEARLKRLEEIAFDGDDLNESVKGLSVNASSLEKALQTVYKNQRDLVDIKDEVQTLHTASDTNASDIKDRKKDTRKIAVVVFVVSALFFSFLSYMHTTAYDGCVKRNDSINVQQQITNNLTSILPENSRLEAADVQAAIDQLEKTKINCETISPLRWRL